MPTQTIESEPVSGVRKNAAPNPLDFAGATVAQRAGLDALARRLRAIQAKREREAAQEAAVAGSETLSVAA